MRPLRLDLAGFAAFREQTTIDFTDADFFALVGPTGSGKSTVLDAICFALYGTVPRWGGTRGLTNALSPSVAEARVRLVFESAGSRYVATRVVRRDGRGNVKTSNAGLQLMPASFDVGKLDTGMSPADLGEVVAGTPAEMEQAVLDAVGLPYEQFTTCVLLPQGQFADFLHARPATRQQILVNLLGLGVYEEVQRRATARATRAEDRLAAIDQLLAGLSDTDDAALTEAAERVAAMGTLAEAVGTAVPGLTEAGHAADRAEVALAALDDELAALDRLRPPTGVTELATVVAAARSEAADAAAAVVLAEEREEKLRGELGEGGDPTALRLMLRAHEDRTRLVVEVEEAAAASQRADQAHAAAVAALEQVRAEVEHAERELQAARATYQEAQTADRAAALRAELSVGDSCPVCTQPVTTVPALPAASAVPAAEAAGRLARAAREDARERMSRRDDVVRDTDRSRERFRARHDQLSVELRKLDTQLVNSPGPETLRRELAALATLRLGLEEAGAAVRAARESSRRTQAAVEAAEERLRVAWRSFDTARDGIARLGPPAVDRDDVATAWAELTGWAADQAQRRRDERVGRAAAVDQARAAIEAVQSRIHALFTEAGLDTTDDPVRAAAVALERAEAAHRRLVERRAEADRLREQRDQHERDARLAKALAGHLRANNFERWLLAEALDLLVDGASRILRELSAGQYELVHAKGEFFVVDHHDAGLRRAVRTLSGGETFQASLALALALSEQLAGLATTTASLESIVLDEGFGTLDAATLEIVASTLENLAALGDRMVGVVTHVPALAERVPVRFEVRKDARTARVERTGR